MRRKNVFIVATLVAWAAVASAQQSVNQTRPAAANGVVEISNIAGSVKVVGWGRTEVQVTGTLGRGTERLDFETSGDRTVVKVVLPRHAHNVDGSDLEIKVPAGSRLEVETVSADIGVTDVTGVVDLEAVSGSVDIDGQPSEVEASSVSGRVTVQAAGAPARVSSVSGDVVVRGAARDVRAKSVSGDVRIEASTVERCEAETTSGSITIDTDLASGADLEAKTVSGRIKVALPAGVDAAFTVTTFSGDIENQLGPAARRTSDYGPGRELEFRNGSGSARVELKSFSGSVQLLRR